MALTGNLDTMGLPEVLQWISGVHKTGTLYLRRGSVEKRIVFQDGEIYSSWSNHPRESLGQFLVRDRLVTEEQLFRALLRQDKERKMLGTILVEDGIIERGQLLDALRTKAEETIYDLFQWPDGAFEFREGEFPQVLHIELPVTEVLLEGIRRVDEWARFRTVFPDPAGTFAVATGASSGNPAEARALELAAAGRTLPEIAIEMRRSEFDAAAILLGLFERGLVQPGRSASAPQPADPVGAIQRLLSLAADRMLQGRHKEAWESYESVLAIDRLNQSAKKGVRAALEALAHEVAQRDAIRLEKVPVLTVDLGALTRERLEPEEAFVLSRVNGAWDVRSILKICPMGEQAALQIVTRLLARRLIGLR
jgi:hypothetical protein